MTSPAVALAALIEELGGAKKGSRRLDFWCWWYGKSTESTKPDPEPPPTDYVEASLRHDDSPRYTTSLDAALTLVPEGYEWAQWPNQGGGRVCSVWKPAERVIKPDEPLPFRTDPVPIGATAALALCIAVLRARSPR